MPSPQKPKPQTQQEWEEDMARQILQLTRSELYLAFRYLDTALSCMPLVPDGDIETTATDGRSLRFSREQQLRLFPQNPLFLRRLYLHSVLHCLFRHLWLREDRDPVLWSLSCDITVEYAIDAMKKDAVRRPLSFRRMQLYETLRQQKIPLAAGPVYRWLLSLPREEILPLRQEFVADDHRYWPTPRQMAAAPRAAKDWEQRAARARTEMRTRGDSPGQGEETLALSLQGQTSKRRYRDFLRRFSAYKEEVHLDPDSFDPGFYAYGLSLYGNLPLIEPQETREAKKIEEFVIAVDTSYSTSGELVRSFLKETFAILQESDSFFARCRIHLLQCDDTVQEDLLLTDEAQIDALLSRFTLRGGGGTDFRPVFSHVARLQKENRLSHLRGLLYFTDGQGIYPKQRPPYDVAFCFAGPFDETAVPPWALRLTYIPEQEEPAMPKEVLL